MSGLSESGNLWHTIQAWLLPALEAVGRRSGRFPRKQPSRVRSMSSPRTNCRNAFTTR